MTSMTGNNVSKLTIVSAVINYVSAAVFATMIAISAYMLLPDPAYVFFVAAGFIAAACFVLAGALQFKKPYSISTLAGSAISLLVMAAHVSFANDASAFLATAHLGWNILNVAIPAVVLAYVCYPLTAIFSIIVFVQSLIAIFSNGSTRQPSAQPNSTPYPSFPQGATEPLSPKGNNRGIAVVLIVVFAALMAVFATKFTISSIRSAEQAAELNEFLSQSAQQSQMKADSLFEKTSFPARGFELENSFDVEEDDISGGYEFFYRSKATGLSWSIYENTDGKLIALLFCVFDDRSPLSGQVESFVLVEEGGNYRLAFMHVGHGSSTLSADEVGAVVGIIDKSTLDSYDERRILDIVQGRESYKEIPQT